MYIRLVFKVNFNIERKPVAIQAILTATLGFLAQLIAYYIYVSEIGNDVNSIEDTKTNDVSQEIPECEGDFQEPVRKDDLNICEPIYSLKGLYETVQNPPLWVKDTIPLKKRSKYVIRNAIDDCHVKESDFKPKERLNRSHTPKTLICHDMMGGYLLDKFIGGTNQGNGFTFHRWAQTDIFCYFSHHFITIPTLPWINLAHKFGTAIIGTLITESQEGQLLCSEFLKDESSYTKFADALVELCVIYKFEGWLLNIENEVSRPEVLLEFTRYLTKKMHERIPASYVIWYDSVTCSGSLDWQNELNEKNRCYFDVCDGIYLNYTWQEEHVIRTCEAAKDRKLDVYVGIDIWGRGSYGGGSFNSYKAAKVIYDHGMSMAIFAHGWVHENNPKLPQNDFLKRYYSRSSLLWKLFWPYMFTTPINECFSTFFRTGVTTVDYNLESQEVQPSYFPSHANTTETVDVEIAKEICKCAQERIVNDHRCVIITSMDVNERDVVHRLFATEIELTGRSRIDIYTDACKDENTDYEIILLLTDSEDIQKVTCASSDLKSKSEELNVITETLIHKDSNNLEHRQFILDFPNYKLLEIAIKIVNGNYLSIRGFAIALE